MRARAQTRAQCDAAMCSTSSGAPLLQMRASVCVHTSVRRQTGRLRKQARAVSWQWARCLARPRPARKHCMPRHRYGQADAFATCRQGMPEPPGRVCGSHAEQQAGAHCSVAGCAMCIPLLRQLATTSRYQQFLSHLKIAHKASVGKASSAVSLRRWQHKLSPVRSSSCSQNLHFAAPLT